MTILTKHSITIKKVPLLNDGCDELQIDVHPSACVKDPLPRGRRQTCIMLLCIFVCLFATVLFGVLLALDYFDSTSYIKELQCVEDQLSEMDHVQEIMGRLQEEKSHRQKATKKQLPSQPAPQQQLPPKQNLVQQLSSEQPPEKLRYQGYFSIPLSKDLATVESRKMALQWKEAEPLPPTKPDIQVVSTDEFGDLSAVLREMLDVNIGDSMERISVFGDGHAVSFLHDFETNATGIVDKDRCFMMDLDPAVVLSPQVFVVGLRQGEEFDVGLVHSTLRAIMPAVRNMAGLARGLVEKCGDKPTYKLTKETKDVIRKRSLETPHDFIHFAGRNVQKIQISNMRALVAYERGRKPLD